MLPKKIISGGQTGADQAGLRFAIAQGLNPGGWCPQGRICEGGRISAADFDRFHLRETESDKYPQRTRLNIRDSDATVILKRSGKLSRGCELTRELCERQGRPYLEVALDSELFGVGMNRQRRDQAVMAAGRALAQFLAGHQPATLNVAGNREGSAPGLGRLVEDILGSAWKQYATFENTPLPILGAGSAPAQMDLFGVPAEPAQDTAGRAAANR
jgi:hypothetical protein